MSGKQTCTLRVGRAVGMIGPGAPGARAGRPTVSQIERQFHALRTDMKIVHIEKRLTATAQCLDRLQTEKRQDRDLLIEVKARLDALAISATEQRAEIREVRKLLEQRIK